MLNATISLGTDTNNPCLRTKSTALRQNNVKIDIQLNQTKVGIWNMHHQFENFPKALFLDSPSCMRYRSRLILLKARKGETYFLISVLYLIFTQ